MSTITIVRLIQLTAVAALTFPLALFLPSFFHATLLLYVARFGEEITGLDKEDNKKEENVLFEAFQEDSRRRKEHFQTGCFMTLSERR